MSAYPTAGPGQPATPVKTVVYRFDTKPTALTSAHQTVVTGGRQQFSIGADRHGKDLGYAPFLCISVSQDIFALTRCCIPADHCPIFGPGVCRGVVLSHRNAGHREVVSAAGAACPSRNNSAVVQPSSELLNVSARPTMTCRPIRGLRDGRIPALRLQNITG